MTVRASANSLERFVEAQERDFGTALAELEAGRKTSHWMWYVFPQLAGLGHSAMAQFYAISDIDEAARYLRRRLLAPRLLRCVNILLPWADRRSAQQIMGHVDALKLRSSLTLFEAAAARAGIGPDPFAKALTLFFEGDRDQRTLELLNIQDAAAGQRTGLS